MADRTHSSDSAVDHSATTGEPRGGGRRGEYQVVARRYRPQTFQELIGQQRVAEALAGAIRSDRVGHAYLFTGARGVGKTSAARILAKALNCLEGVSATPCNRCDVCRAVSSGDDVDVIEIDGASNRGIDEMRQLRQSVNIRPSRARFKIYIIDEVHMLTKEAFNALLKTLEEPPGHVKFVFCTTEPEKIPITILSRCQRFDFAGIQTDSIASRLQQIAVNEGVEIEPDAVELLARRAAGSMRDSQSLLEQLLSISGQRISAADVHHLLGTAGDARLGELVQALVERDAAAALATLDQAVSEGVDVGQLLAQLLGYLRDLLVAAVGGPTELFQYCTRSQWPHVQESGRSLGVPTLLAMLQIVEQTLARLRYSTQGRVLAELALVRISHLENLEQLSTLLGEMPPIAGTPAVPATRVAAPAAPTPAPAPPSVATTTADSKKNYPSEVAAAAEPAVCAVEPTPNRGALNEQSVRGAWEQVLATLGDMTSRMAESYERVAISAPNRLVVSFAPKYTSCKSYCERPEQRSRLEQAMSAVTGCQWSLEFQVLDSEPEASGDSQPTRSRGPSPPERRVDVSEHPLFRRVAEVFEARVLKVDEPAPAVSGQVPS